MLDFVGAPDTADIAWYKLQAVTDFKPKKIGARRIGAFSDADILVGVVGDHIPAGQDFALNIQFRPLAAGFADCPGTTTASAFGLMLKIRRGNVLFGQIEIRQGCSQAAIEKLGLDTHLPLLGTLGR